MVAIGMLLVVIYVALAVNEYEAKWRPYSQGELDWLDNPHD